MIQVLYLAMPKHKITLAKKKKTFCDIKHNVQIKDARPFWGAGKTRYLLSASFRYRNGYIWQAILT